MTRQEHRIHILLECMLRSHYVLLCVCLSDSTAGKHSAAAKATEKLIQLELNQTVTGSEVKHPYGGIYACLILPSLVVGTVGGGTALATQKECLNLMGCHGQVSCTYVESSRRI